MPNTARNTLYGFETRAIDERRAQPGERKTHDIKQLWQRNHEILRMALFTSKHKDIAKSLGISEATVSNTLNSELGMRKLSALREERDQDTMDAAKRAAELIPKAMETYNQILEGNPSVTKMMKETADTIVMDIGGYRAPTRTQSESAHVHMTPQDLVDFKSRGKEAARAAGMIVEIASEKN